MDQWHGHTKDHAPSREYHTWLSMIARCENSNATSFKYYGGRGIKVCPRWRKSFKTFLADMGPRPEGTTIDRINNNGNYRPGNCRWATWLEQAGNTRRKRKLDAQIEEKKKIGRPPTRKKLLTLRLEPEIVEFFRATGPGWLQRVNDVLKNSMEKRQRRARGRSG